VPALSNTEMIALRDRILAEEAELQFTSFTYEDAWNLGSQIRQAALEQGLPVAIQIRRNHAQLFYTALPGAALDNTEWLRRKCAVVDRFEHASMVIGLNFQIDGKSFDVDSRLPVDDFAAHGGAFPLIVRGVGVVGTIAVSGLPQLDDHNLVVEQVRAFLAQH